MTTSQEFLAEHERNCIFQHLQQNNLRVAERPTVSKEQEYKKTERRNSTTIKRIIQYQRMTQLIMNSVGYISEQRQRTIVISEEKMPRWKAR